MRIGIFGGTFNPPHLGHLHIAKDFRAQMEALGKPLDKLLIIPTFVPPHKETPDLASGKDRLAMCQKAFPDFSVSDLEISRGDVSFTYMTLEQLHKEYDGVGPDGEPAQLYFLMGDDMLLYLPHWARPEKILEDAVLVSTIRSNDCTVETLRAFAKDTYPAQYAAGRFLFFESTPFPVSSTEVRGLLKGKDGKSPKEAEEKLQTLLDPTVLQYILERGLYS